MLNISDYSVADQVRKKNFKTLNAVEGKRSSRILIRLIAGTLIIGLVILFLPWTQNIRSNGQITTLTPDNRPQKIYSVLSGRVEKWYVKEGDFVKQGDTIAFISEVKSDYFDDKLLERTSDQTELKKLSVRAYEEKITALDKQINALANQRDLKLNQAKIKFQQTQLKVANDSIAFQAASVGYQTANNQYERTKVLFDKGLKSKTDLENKNIKLQENYASLVAAENNFLTSKSELIAVQLELSTILMKYETDVAKARSSKYSALSNKLNAEGDVVKFENSYSNYEKRNAFYFICAPQDCYITQQLINGIGETVKAGEPIVSIMPTNYKLAAAIYVDPIDLPLLKIGGHTRLQFDGWPAVVFSGWPNASHGTYGGRIYAIDQYISENGKYRILVEEDPNDHPWPEALRYGGGLNAMLLLNDVPIWYELWRKINGFPPNYYTKKSAATENKKQ